MRRDTREGGGFTRCGGDRRIRNNRRKPRYNIFQQQRGRGGDGNMEGVVGAREEERSRFLVVTCEGKEIKGFLVCWYRAGKYHVDSGRKMMDGEVVHRTAGGEGGADPISKLCTNNRQSLGLEWSMYEVGTPPPHNSYRPH